jgi:hypothetical protein
MSCLLFKCLRSVHRMKNQVDRMLSVYENCDMALNGGAPLFSTSRVAVECVLHLEKMVF